MTLEEQIVKLNEIKRSYGNKVFKADTLYKDLQKSGFKCGKHLIAGLTKYGIIEAVSTNIGTRFTEVGKPIYIRTLEHANNYVKELIKKYAQNKTDKLNKSFSIEDAIKLLKENGYKVYKPTTTYEEI